MATGIGQGGRRDAAGFTLVEMVMVIIIAGIVASMAATFIRWPMEGYIDLSRRAGLVDSAEMALRQVARDIRRALPNSVRCDSDGDGACDDDAVAIEMLNTIDAAIYRYYPPPGAPEGTLDFDTADGSFNVYDHFRNIDYADFPSTGHFLAINTVNNVAPYQAPGAGSAVRTPNGTNIDIAVETADLDGDGNPDSDEDRVTITGGYQFDPFSGGEPPELDESIQGRRVYVVEGPITYLCDAASGELRRYRGHGINPSFSAVDSDAELVANGAVRPDGTAGGSLVADHAVCAQTSFVYTPGTAQRAGLATLTITLEEEGERVTLLHQVHVVNVP